MKILPKPHVRLELIRKNTSLMGINMIILIWQTKATNLVLMNQILYLKMKVKCNRQCTVIEILLFSSEDKIKKLQHPCTFLPVIWKQDYANKTMICYRKSLASYIVTTTIL